jgi:acetyl-CoA carboxylase carboxyltransferase component
MAFEIDNVIDPAETRAVLAAVLARTRTLSGAASPLRRPLALIFHPG